MCVVNVHIYVHTYVFVHVVIYVFTLMFTFLVVTTNVTVIVINEVMQDLYLKTQPIPFWDFLGGI